MQVPSRPIRLILLLVLLAGLFPAAALAQEDTLESAVQAFGLNDVQVTVAEDEVLVEYRQAVADFGSMDVELERIAHILDLVAQQVTPERPVRIRQLFDDGQVMELVGDPADGRAYLAGDLGADDFQQALIYQPRTRGPLVVEGVCQPAGGDSCENSEACACYPTERCAPADPAADERGCVASGDLPNAHLEAGQYVCDEGYQWNDAMDGCVAMPGCPAGSYAAGDTCLPLGGSQEKPAAIGIDLPFDSDFSVPQWAWFAVLGCCGVLVLLAVIVIWLLLRRRKRKKAAAPRRPVPTPAHRPQRPPLFAQAERRFADIHARYRAGAVSEETYRAALRELTFRDAAGQYWAYGPAGWQWYDGQRWVPREPPAA